MITVKWYDEIFNAAKAVRTGNQIIFYNENNIEIQKIFNLFGSEWNHISLLSGEWSDPSDIPSQEEILRADMDFLTMENEYLEQVNEQQQADIDFCLMLLEE